jgi:hypothetical protein
MRYLNPVGREKKINMVPISRYQQSAEYLFYIRSSPNGIGNYKVGLNLFDLLIANHYWSDESNPTGIIYPLDFAKSLQIIRRTKKPPALNGRGFKDYLLYFIQRLPAGHPAQNVCAYPCSRILCLNPFRQEASIYLKT